MVIGITTRFRRIWMPLLGTQSDGIITGTGIAASPRQYSLQVVATVASDGRSFRGNWNDSDGRSGDYHGVRRSQALPEAGASSWRLPMAALVLLGAAVLSRGARKHLRSPVRWQR